MYEKFEDTIVIIRRHNEGDRETFEVMTST